MTFEEFKLEMSKLSTVHTGSSVYKLVEDDYLTVPYPHGEGYEGFILVKLADGIFALPYGEVGPPWDGYEQLDQDGYYMATPELILDAYMHLSGKASALLDFHYKYGDKSVTDYLVDRVKGEYDRLGDESKKDDGLED